MAKGRKLLVGLGAACAAGLGYAATILWRRRGSSGGHEGARPAISGSGGQGPVGDSGAARSAGPDAMRDPPREWENDEHARDANFPASDPPEISPHVN